MKTATKPRILSVRIVRATDESPDTSYLGEYTERGSDACIRRSTGRFVADERRAQAILDRAERLKDDAEETPGARPSAAYWRGKRERLAKAFADLLDPPIYRGEYNFFKAYGCGEPAGSKAWRANAKADFERIERLQVGEWCYIGVYAEARVCLGGSDVTQTLRSGGLYGIESDSGQEYLASVADDELEGLRGELAAAGFGRRAIDAAFKDIETVNL